MAYYGYPRYVSVAEKRAKAEQKLKKLKKQNPDIHPIVITGQTLAKTWWGKEWNKNLERYADYSNRIGRGKSYVRNNAVLDLKITPGRVEAMVSGSGSHPYSVVIQIQPIPEKSWAHFKQSCKGKLDSLKQILAGDFPQQLGTIFTQEKGGLFPIPKEIKFDCSCPDWASMCKHVAATLYGVGARLDEDPGLFFVLRKVDIKDLVTETLEESKKELLSKARQKTSRVIRDESGLSEMFGIDLGQMPPEPKAPLPKPLKAKTPKLKSPAQTPPESKTPELKTRKSPARKKPPEKTIKTTTAIGKIEWILSREDQGMSVSTLTETSGMETIKVRNILFRLKKMGKVKTLSWGVYHWIG